MWSNRTVYVFIVILWTAADSEQEEDALPCGPLKKRLSERDECYDEQSNAEIPCPNESKRGRTVLKVCRPPYALNRDENPIQNVTYTCGLEERWMPHYAACQLDCGKPTANNKYPWIVAIYDEEDELQCTGTIISAYHVVTDTLCFNYTYVHDVVNKIEHKYIDMLYASNYTIVAGKHYSNIHRKQKSAQIRKIKKATIGTRVMRSVGWLHSTDIVLLEVESEFDFFNDVQPACLDWDDYYEKKDFNEDRSKCGKSIGVGLFFKSNSWRYYLRGITRRIVTDPEVTYGLYTTVSLLFSWLRSEMILNPNLHNLFFTWGLRKTEIGCILPEHVKYGRFKLVLGEAFRPGAWVSTRTNILLTCTANTDVSVSTNCNLGQWQPPIDQLECKRPGTCPPLLPLASEDIVCRNNGQTVNCAEPENNTTAVIRCKPFHAISGNKPIYECQDGEWDQPFTRCTLECGTKRIDVTTLIIGGSNATKNEYPWVVAVYQMTEQICGGTIISKSFVLSAAHCFTTSNGTALDKRLYTLIGGKYYSNFSTEESSAQRREIKTLHIHGDYRGILQKYRDDIALIEVDAKWTPSWEVQPACLDWDNKYEDFDFIEGNKAVVAGWGYVSQDEVTSSEVLKKLVISYRPKDVCIANLPKGFSHQYVVEDKICAGDHNSSMNVCQGDSGGGLYFQSGDERFYVRGIVSLIPRTSTNTCDINKFALYTKVSKYLQWMEKIVRRVL